VLAGETTSRHKIEALLEKLKESRPAQQPVIREETKIKEVFRLVADCGDSRSSAEKRLHLISRTFKNTFMIRDGNSYCVVVGSLTSEQAAEQEQKRVAGKGLHVKIVKYRVPLVVWQVVVGRFATAADADAMVKAIAAEGILATVVESAV
jgi:cell division protein FtsN